MSLTVPSAAHSMFCGFRSRWSQLDACSTCAAESQRRCWRGMSPLSPGADVVRLGADVCGVRPVPAQMFAGVSPHSPGADAGGDGPI